MEPKPLLLRRLPHVSLLAFPWARIFGGIRAQSPDLANLLGDFLRDQVRAPAVHRTVTGGVDHEIGRQLAAVRQDHGMLREPFDVYAALQFDSAIGHHFRSTDAARISEPAP